MSASRSNFARDLDIVLNEGSSVSGSFIFGLSSTEFSARGQDDFLKIDGGRYGSSRLIFFMLSLIEVLCGGYNGPRTESSLRI